MTASAQSPRANKYIKRNRNDSDNPQLKTHTSMEAKRAKLMKENQERIASFSKQPPIRLNAAKPSKVKLSTPSSKAAGSSPISVPSSQWDLENIFRQGTNFKNVRRISAKSPKEEVLGVIQEHDESGEPLIIEGFHELGTWPREVFNINWLLEHYGKQECCVRDVNARSDHESTLSNYIKYARRPASERKQTLYYKDAHCPDEWAKCVKSKDLIPSTLQPHCNNDLFQYLTPQESVESLMCYLGAGDTLTPCHKDLCASSGHNIMCYTENGGSSLWFMTATPDAPHVGAFFQEELHSEVDWERRTVTVEQFAKAPCTVYVADQKLGDLVLVPPRSCHQVVNRGGLTVKTSWSRMTHKGLAMALRDELPIYRRVCRPEQYRVKYIVYRSMLQKHQDLCSLVDDENSRTTTQDDVSQMVAIPEVKELLQSISSLVQLFDTILLEEFMPHDPETPTIFTDLQQMSELLQSRHASKRKPKPSARATRVDATSFNFACDFCGADIFQSFFECQQCSINLGDDVAAPQNTGDGLIICPSCYVEGRTCTCGSMRPSQCRPFHLLLQTRNKSARLLRRFGGDFSKYTDLNERDLPAAGQMRISEAAYLVWKGRRTAPKSRPGTKCVKCKSTVKRDYGIYCNPCHYSWCYKHLLECGIHSVEALLMRKGQTNSWHSRHGGPNDTPQRDTINAGDEENTEDPFRRQAMVTRRYPTCCSLNPHATQPGWYDAPESEPEAQHSHEKVQDAINNKTIPPGEEKGKSPLSPLASESSLSSVPDEPLTLPTSQDRPCRFLMDCILLDPPAKRRNAPSIDSDSDRPIKRRKTLKAAKSRLVATATPDSDEEDRRVSEDYAPNLAQALSVVNSEQPHFSVQKSNQQKHIQLPTLPTVEGTPAVASATSGPTFENLPNIPQTNPRSSVTLLESRQASQKKSSTPIRGKRGQPPGLRTTRTHNGPPKLGSGPAPARKVPAKVDQSTNSPPQDVPQPSPPSTLPQMPPASSSKSQSHSTSQDSIIERSKSTLQRLKARIDDLTEANRSLEQEVKALDSRWDARLKALESHFQDEIRRKNGNIHRMTERLQAMGNELAQERQARGQLSQHLHENLIRFVRDVNGPVHQVAREVARQTAETEVERIGREASKKTTQGAQPAPSTDDSTSTNLKSFVQILPELLTLMRTPGPDSSRPELPSIPTQSIPQSHAQILVPYIPAPATSLHERPDLPSILPNMMAREVPTPSVYQQPPQLSKHNSLQPHGHSSPRYTDDTPRSRGRSQPPVDSESSGKRRASHGSSRSRRDYGDHSASSTYSREDAAVEQVEDPRRHRRRETSRSRSDRHTSRDRGGHRTTEPQKDDEAYSSRPTAPGYYSDVQRGGNSSYSRTESHNNRPSSHDDRSARFPSRRESAKPPSRPLRQ